MPGEPELAKALFEQGFDVTLDGVVTIDPVAVSYLLAGTGPVDLGAGVVLDQDNVVTALLHTVYTQIQDTEKQDDFFELANDRIFEAFTSGQGDPSVVLSSFVRGVQENRVSFWADRDDEQELIAPTALSGALPADDGSTPHVGIYFSDAAGTKMEYFLNYDSTMRATNCLDGDRQVLTTTTTMTSNAPANAASLTPFVTGRGDFLPRGLMRLNVRLFAPHGGTFTSVRLDDQTVSPSAVSFEGRGLARVEVVLRPGQVRTLTANITSGPGQSADPQFATTPGIVSLRNDYTVPSACQ